MARKVAFPIPAREAHAKETIRRPALMVLPTDAKAYGSVATVEAEGQDTVAGTEVGHGRVVEAQAIAKAAMASVVAALPLRVGVRKVRAGRRPATTRGRTVARLVTVPGMA